MALLRCRKVTTRRHFCMCKCKTPSPLQSLPMKSLQSGMCSQTCMTRAVVSVRKVSSDFVFDSKRIKQK